ncbi:MAG: cysteine desulfurase [Ignavibacteriales bacterium]|nr:cysteine desulfurase [Ignavibacteriales bacterium]MCF8305014.1 cysteine desulfurase [Ignavibacteriales bacterium]MCF8314703.1 cysteine desulfurase [Ignavibacteriales bacterium]MCF8438049.1 cysteine desulfurase [Ignavibacteriales bacterium]
MKKAVYLDHAATTPLHPKVFEVMSDFLRNDFGNPSSVHSYGRSSRVKIESARETIAEIINAHPAEIYFTSNGTEANNFALFGITKTKFAESGETGIITAENEHHCILEPAESLVKDGFRLTILKPRNDGTIDPDTLNSALNADISLAAFMLINNETGSVNDVAKLSDTAINKQINFHTDAVQAFGKYQIDVKKLSISTMAVSGHKINGPKGSGFLYARTGTPIAPLIHGGSQERNRRGGTENPAAIIGLAEAARIAVNGIDENFEKVTKLNNYLRAGIISLDSAGISINSPRTASPYILNISFKPVYYTAGSESLIMYFDINGIAASSGAACASGTTNPSHVLLSLGKSKTEASAVVRFSFGHDNTFEELDYTLEVLQKAVKKFRKI